MNVAQAAILGEVLNERDRQDVQWGGTEHDDEHVPMDWFNLIVDQKMKLEFTIASSLVETDAHLKSYGSGHQVSLVPQARERLLKIAALALAGVESIDRREKT
jgi:hypothetical protein